MRAIASGNCCMMWTVVSHERTSDGEKKDCVDTLL
jgi:hypothetical protein